MSAEAPNDAKSGGVPTGAPPELDEVTWPEILPHGVALIDGTLQVRFVNTVAARQLGMQVDEIVGRSLEDLHPRIRSTRLFRVVEACLRTRRPQRGLTRAPTRDRGPRWILLAAAAVADCAVVTSIDVTDEREALRSQVRRSRTWSQAVGSMTQAVLTTDTEGRVRSMNPAAARLLGAPGRVVVGCRLLDRLALRGNDGQPLSSEVIRDVLEQGGSLGVSSRVDLAAAEGDLRPIELSCSPQVDAVGTRRGVVLVVQDLTERMEMVASQRRTWRLEAIGRLAGGVAHDFNNILTVILGQAELGLARLGDAHALQASLRQIRGAADRAAGLTRQLLAFSRKQALRPRSTDLNEAIQDLRPMLERLIGEDVQLVTELDPDLHPVRFDPDRLDQILVNLLVNAHDAMPDGGRIVVRTTNVGPRHRSLRPGSPLRKSGCVRLAVSDTGVGMDSATRERAFEPFFTTKPRDQGTGLGLSTVLGIVEQTGGTIEIESRLGRGSTFIVDLPRATEPAARVSRDDVDATPADVIGTVLVVEDEPEVLELFSGVLRSAGFTVLTAEDGEAALDVVTDRGADLDLVLTDVVMPRMSGPELAEQARELFPALKIVFVSGYTDDELRRKGMLDPSISLLDKPISPSELVERVSGYVRRVRQR